MKRQLPTTLAVLGLVWLSQSAPVGGQDLSVSGTASGGIRITKSGSGSPGLGLTSRLSVRALSETPTTAVDGTAAIGFSLNRGDTDTSLSAGIGARTEFKRTRLSTRLSFSRVPTNFAELDFSGDTLDLINLEGTRTRTSLSFNGDHDLDSRTVARAALSYTRTDYEPVNADQVPSDNYTLSAGVTHDLNRRTRLIADTRFGWFTSESAADTESFSASASAGLRHELDSRTTVNGSLGLSFVNTEETAIGVRTSTWNTAILLDAGISHAYSDGTVSLGLSQKVGPGTDGAMEVNVALNGSISYDINAREQILVNGRLSRLSNVDGGGSETVLTLAPSYKIEIADGLDARAAYTLQNADGDTSHRLSLDVSKTFEGRQ